MRLAMFLGGALAACSAAPEEPPLLPGTLPPPCELQRITYVVDEVTGPISASEVSGFAIDLDGDADTDNFLGNARGILGDLGAANELAAAIDYRVRTGALLWLIHVETCDQPGDAHLRVSLDVGQDVDADPLNNLTGDGSLRSVGQAVLPAVGTSLGGNLEAGLGAGIGPLPALFDVDTAESSPWLPAAALSLKGSVAGNALELTIDLAYAEDEVASGILEPLQRTLQSIFDEAPGCPEACDDASVDFYVDTVDGNRDGTVTQEEVLNSFPYVTWTHGDLDLLATNEGVLVYWPNHDGAKDVLSLGIGVHAVTVNLVP